MIKKSFISTLLLATTLSHLGVSIDIPYSLNDFLNKGTGLNAGYVEQNGSTFYKAGLSTDFSQGHFSAGLNFNHYFPSNAQLESFNNVTFRHISYENPNFFGLRWGRLTNVTYGHGLLMNHYDSGSAFNTAETLPEHAGLKGFIKINQLRLDALRTARGLYAGRVSQIFPNSFIGPEIKIGGTYINDDQPPGALTKKAGYASDISMPLLGNFLIVYGEYAKLENHGDAQAGGLRGDIFQNTDYKLEYRNFKDFVPGYFGRLYEQAPATIPTDTTSTSGFLANLGTTWLDGHVKTNVQYENYDTTKVFSCGLAWKPIMGTAAVLHYTQAFNPSVVPQLDADILLNAGAPIETSFGIRQLYFTDRTETSYTFGASLSLTRVFGLPF